MPDYRFDLLELALRGRRPELPKVLGGLVGYWALGIVQQWVPYALALAAARDYPELIILLMTGFADQRERASGLDAIIHDVITKPFAVADIRTAVADALASRKTD